MLQRHSSHIKCILSLALLLIKWDSLAQLLPRRVIDTTDDLLVLILHLLVLLLLVFSVRTSTASSAKVLLKLFKWLYRMPLRFLVSLSWLANL